MAKRRKSFWDDDVTVTTGAEYTYGKGVHGRKVTFKIHPIRNGIQIRRGGRRGGVRSVGKAQGGMVVCTAQGASSKCIRGKSMVVFPGGSAKVKRWGSGMMLNGYSKTNRRTRRTRRYSKRRGR